MDISKYRDNVELSDVCIVVKEHEYNLHKFPLSISSEYFKEKLKNSNKIVINDFPGEWTTFELIADHCYGKEVDINEENVVSLLFSAEFFGMQGKHNLVEKCQKFIDRIFRSAEYSKSIEVILPLLESVKKLDAELSRPITERALRLIIDLWLRRKCHYKTHLPETYFEDSLLFEELMKLNSHLIEQIIEACASDVNIYPYLSKLVFQYVQIHVIDKFENGASNTKIAESVKNPGCDSSSNSSIIEMCASENSSTDFDKESVKHTKSKAPSTEKDGIGELFDNIILVLPTDINLGKKVSVHWLQKCIDICNTFKCKSKNKLLKLCGGVLIRVPPDDIKTMDPKNVTEMIEQILEDDKVDKDLMKWIWDNSFLEMAKNDALDPVVFRKVVKNMPESQEVDPDVVFQIVLSSLNKIGNDGKQSQDDLIDCVILDQISPENLEAALASQFWKAEDVCKAAINRLKISFKGSQLDKKKFESYSATHQSYEDPHREYNDHYGYTNKNLSSWKSQSFTNSFPVGDNEDHVMNSYEPVSTYYPPYKHLHTTYTTDSYLTLEENLKYELKKISDSYMSYYKDRFSLRSRRRYPCSASYNI